MRSWIAFHSSRSKREVAHEVTQLLAFAGGAHDDAHAVGDVQFAEDFLEALALLGIFDLARDAGLVGVRQQHEETAGQHEVGRDARAFGADGAFRDLHDDVRAGRIQARNVLLRDLGPLRAAALAFALDDFHAGVELVRHDVPVMQEGVFLEADVHERGLQAVFEVADLPLKMLPTRRSSVVRSMLNSSSLPSSVTATRVSSVSALMMTSLWIFFSGRMSRWTFLTMFDAAVLDGLDQTLRLLGNFHRLELLLRDRRGGGRGFGACVACGCACSAWAVAGFGLALRRQTGGDVFGAFDFVLVAFFKQAVVAALFADHVGAGLDGVAVGFLVSGVQAAFGLETHSAAAPREVIVAHSLVSSSMDVDVLHQAHGDQRAQH